MNETDLTKITNIATMFKLDSIFLLALALMGLILLVKSITHMADSLYRRIQRRRILISQVVTTLNFSIMGISLTPVKASDIFLLWKMQSRPPPLITLARSKKWMIGSVLRLGAATIFAACAGLTGSFVVTVGLLGSRG